MLDRFFYNLKVSRRVRAGVFGFTPIDTTSKKDRETINCYGGYPRDDKALFRREISEQQQLALWRLHAGGFTSPDTYLSYDTTITYVLNALTHRDGLSDIRFKYSEAEGRHCGAIRKPEVFAVTLDPTPRVFEIQRPFNECWHSQQRALITILANQDWWRPWTEEDTAIAKANIEDYKRLERESNLEIRRMKAKEKKSQRAGA